MPESEDIRRLLNDQLGRHQLFDCPDQGRLTELQDMIEEFDVEATPDHGGERQHPPCGVAQLRAALCDSGYDTAWYAQLAQPLAIPVAIGKGDIATHHERFEHFLDKKRVAFGSL